MGRRSELLIDSNQNLILQTSLAVVVGDREAIALQQIHYWCDLNERADKETHFFDGQYWTFNTWREWHNENFPFWSIPTIRRVFESLEAKTLILTRPHENNHKGVWATINYDELETLRTQKGDKLKVRRQRRRQDQMNNVNPDQNDQGGLIKMIRGSDQNDQGTGNTETNTETTTEKKRLAPDGAAVTTSTKKRKDDNPQIPILIDAWIKGLPGGAPARSPYANKTIRDAAGSLAQRGITAEQVTRYTAFLSTQDFWHGKTVSFTYMADNIGAWLTTQPRATVQRVIVPFVEEDAPIPLPKPSASARMYGGGS